MWGWFAAARSRERFEEDFLAQGAHFIDQLFQAAVLGDGEAKGLSLLLGKCDRHGLGFDFARPTPRPWMPLGDAALGE